MREYKRKNPMFALCGLQCGLCPRHQTDAPSKCPGCGGADFHLKHPSCAVITCNLRRDNVEYCFQCPAYPCERYGKPGKVDSFISYRNVIPDFQKAKEMGIERSMVEWDRKRAILEFLLGNYDDGRRKGFYCLAVNLLAMEDLEIVLECINREVKNQNIDKKQKIEKVIGFINGAAREKEIELKLRK
jgi:hypothetical protein